MPLRCRPIHAYKVHAGEMHAHEVRAYEGFYEDLARQNTVTRLFQLQLGFWRRHMGFCVVAYGFQSSSWCPKGHYLGRCTVCLSSTCLSVTFLSI
jgi:hypothetical protein